MEKQAAEMMGEPVLAGAVIATAGTLSKMAVGAAVGGLAGAAIGSAMARKSGPTALPGDYKGLMYVAAGPSKVGFFAVKRGLLKNAIKAPLFEVPRGQVRGFEVGGGTLSSSITVTMADGSVYALECGRALKGKAEKVRRELGV